MHNLNRIVYTYSVGENNAFYNETEHEGDLG